MSETAERLMDLAEVRMRDAGYAGFSFRELASEAGIKSASVHHHFPTKAAMVAAVAQRYGNRFFSAIAPQLTKSAGEAISLYRETFRKSLLDGRMCLFGVLGSESGALTLEVTDEIQSFFRRCVADLSERIGGPRAEQRAFHVMATLEGGMMLSRAYRSVEAFDKATEVLVSDHRQGEEAFA